MKIKILVVADYATIDEITKKVNILGIFTAIFARSFPAKHGRMVIVAKISADLEDKADEKFLTITLWNDDRKNELAQLPYTTIVFRNRISDGEGYVYVAFHPELDGCMAQGETLVEAKAFLNEVRFDYIAHLLEHNLPVPQPSQSTLISLTRENIELLERDETSSSETFFALPV